MYLLRLCRSPHGIRSLMALCLAIAALFMMTSHSQAAIPDDELLVNGDEAIAPNVNQRVSIALHVPPVESAGERRTAHGPAACGRRAPRGKDYCLGCSCRLHRFAFKHDSLERA